MSLTVGLVKGVLLAQRKCQSFTLQSTKNTVHCALAIMAHFYAVDVAGL